MGASYCVYALTWCDGELNWEAGYKCIDELIEGEYESPYGHCSVEEDQDSLKTDLDDFKALFDSNNFPNVAILTICHLQVLITGGETWGDDPSETFGLISRLSNEVEVLQAIGFWEDVEVNYKSILTKIIKARKDDLPTLLGLDDHLDKLIEQEMRQ